MVETLPPASEPVAGGRLVTPRFLLVTAATLLYFVTLGMMLPTVPRYVEDELGGGGWEVGLAVGSFAVSAALLRPLAGRLGDWRGRRRLVVGGSLLVSISVLGHLLADSLALLVAVRLVTGIGEAAMWVGAATATQDMAPDDRRGEAASYYSLALYAGLALGPAIGEVLADNHGFDSVWIVGAAIALGAAILGLGTPVGRTTEHFTRGGPWLHRAALGPGVLLFVGLFPFIGFTTFMPVYGDEVGVADMGPVFGVYAGLVLMIRLVGARLPDRLGWRWAFTAALISIATASVLLALSGGAAGVWVATVALAIGMSLLFPALFSVSVTAAPEEERSQAVGTFSVFFDLASGIGPAVLGIVVTLSSERVAFGVAAAVAASGFAAVRWVNARQTTIDFAGATEPGAPP